MVKNNGLEINIPLVSKKGTVIFSCLPAVYFVARVLLKSIVQ